jgi:hypothetical protein
MRKMESKMNSGDHLKEAALQGFVAQKTRARANLEVYLTTPVGIGEHPDLVDVINVLVKEIAEADECIQVIRGLS